MQVGNWVAHSILQFEVLEERVEVLQQFIAIAKVRGRWWVWSGSPGRFEKYI